MKIDDIPYDFLGTNWAKDLDFKDDSTESTRWFREAVVETAKDLYVQYAVHKGMVQPEPLIKHCLLMSLAFHRTTQELFN